MAILAKTIILLAYSFGIGRMIFYTSNASQSLAYQSRVLPSSEGIYSETSRAACVPRRCGCCTCTTRFTRFKCFTAAIRKRKCHARLWYRPRNAAYVYAFCKLRQPAEHPGRSAFTYKKRAATWPQQTRRRWLYNYSVVCDCAIVTMSQREFSFCHMVFVLIHPACSIPQFVVNVRKTATIKIRARKSHTISASKLVYGRLNVIFDTPLRNKFVC